MWFPKGRHPDSITYIRNTSPDSWRRVVGWLLTDNGCGNVPCGRERRIRTGLLQPGLWRAALLHPAALALRIVRQVRYGASRAKWREMQQNAALSLTWQKCCVLLRRKKKSDPESRGRLRFWPFDNP